MTINSVGMAGTLESSDVLIQVKANSGKGIEIDLDSIVEKQYGKQIRKVVQEELEKLGVNNAGITIQDKGALDCTIRARLEAAVFRAAGIETYAWEEL